ncbi:MAG: GrpB family protein [Planctomycetota bacterium]
MPLTSTITDYDAEWPRLYREEVERLTPVFEGTLIAIHHIGSTAIPGLLAKPEIDMLAVVPSVDSADRWAVRLDRLGYTRGGDLSSGHLFFKRSLNGVRTHKLHVCRRQHFQIDSMLKFRDQLRTCDDLRRQYGLLKRKLERENSEGIGEYLAGKAPFIRAVLASIEPAEGRTEP